MRKIFFAAILASIAMTPAGVLAQTLRALPFDEGPSNQSFSNYRDNLLKAIESRDVDYIVSQASSDVHLSFGGMEGRDALRDLLTVDPQNLSEEYRHLAPQIREKYWADLESTLRLGGRFESEVGNVFLAPYILDCRSTGDFGSIRNVFRDRRWCSSAEPAQSIWQSYHTFKL